MITTGTVTARRKAKRIITDEVDENPSQKKCRRTLKVIGLSMDPPIGKRQMEDIARSLHLREPLLHSYMITDTIIFVKFDRGRNFGDWPLCFYRKHGINQHTVKSSDVKFCDLYESFDKDGPHVYHEFKLATLERVMRDDERHKTKTRTEIYKSLSPTELLQTGLCSAEKLSSVSKFKEEINRLECDGRDDRRRKWVPPGKALTICFRYGNTVRIQIPNLRYESDKGCKYYYHKWDSHGVRFEDIMSFDANNVPVLRVGKHDDERDNEYCVNDDHYRVNDDEDDDDDKDKDNDKAKDNDKDNDKDKDKDIDIDIDKDIDATNDAEKFTDRISTQVEVENEDDTSNDTISTQVEDDEAANCDTIYDENYEHYLFMGDTGDKYMNATSMDILLDQKNDISYRILSNMGIDDVSKETSDRLRDIDTAYKKRHVYIYSDSNYGKTIAITYIVDKFRGEKLSLTNGFSTLKDTSLQFMLFDEYSEHNLVDMSTLNQLTDGSLEHNVKYGPKIRVTDVNLTVIIFSNFSPEEVYRSQIEKMPNYMMPFYERFTVHQLVENPN